MFLIYNYNNNSYTDEDTSIQSEDIPPMNDPVSATRVLCGALLLPTIASLCGRIFFESISSNFQRTLLVCINSLNYKNTVTKYIILKYIQNYFIKN